MLSYFVDGKSTLSLDKETKREYNTIMITVVITKGAMVMKLSNRSLQILMAERIITVTELAEMAGLSRVFIGSCVAGTANPKPATIGKIARALNVPVQEIIETSAATLAEQK